MIIKLSTLRKNVFHRPQLPPLETLQKRGKLTRALSAQLRVVYTIAGPPVTEMAQRVHCASVDPTYRDLLDFYRKAQEAFNPRPFGYNMVERLEKRFGNRDSACKALGIKRRELNPMAVCQVVCRISETGCSCDACGIVSL